MTRIAILGVGALGCLFGARLAPYAEVILIGQWPEQITHLNTHALKITYPDGHVESIHLTATDHPLTQPPVDYALILTKANKTKTAAFIAGHILKSEGVALTLQNGLGNLEALQSAVGVERASLGVTTQGATMIAPGHIHYGGAGQTYLAGESPRQAQIGFLRDLFTHSGIPTTLLSSIQGMLWGKLAVSASINPLTALLRVSNGELLNSAHTRALLRQAAGEVAMLAQAKNIPLPYPSAPDQAELVARQTTHNRSSMLQDVLRGAETEIESINGALMREAEALGIPTPLITHLYQLVKGVDELRPPRSQPAE